MYSIAYGKVTYVRGSYAEQCSDAPASGIRQSRNWETNHGGATEQCIPIASQLPPLSKIAAVGYYPMCMRLGSGPN